MIAAEQRHMHATIPLPSRVQQLQSLKNTHEFDVLVIGGGATGSGVALDSVSRGEEIKCDGVNRKEIGFVLLFLFCRNQGILYYHDQCYTMLFVPKL